MPRTRVEIIRRGNRFHWRIVRNGRMVAISVRTFASRRTARENVQALLETMRNEYIDVVEVQG